MTSTPTVTRGAATESPVLLMEPSGNFFWLQTPDDKLKVYFPGYSKVLGGYPGCGYEETRTTVRKYLYPIQDLPLNSPLGLPPAFLTEVPRAGSRLLHTFQEGSPIRWEGEPSRDELLACLSSFKYFFATEPLPWVTPPESKTVFTVAMPLTSATPIYNLRRSRGLAFCVTKGKTHTLYFLSDSQDNILNYDGESLRNDIVYSYRLTDPMSQHSAYNFVSRSFS